jgi:hypothetical protein
MNPVAWQWGGGKPGGVAAEVATEGEITMETKNGNEVKKNASPDNPAVYVERSGHDAVKRASELEVQEKGDNKKGDNKKDDSKENGDKPPPKKKGRPAKNPNAPPKPKKEPKKAATETGEPRRSGRNR